MKEEDLFNYSNASKVEVNAGGIKCIWLEGSNIRKIDHDGCVELETGEYAIIELENGKRILITNSEWASIYLF